MLDVAKVRIRNERFEPVQNIDVYKDSLSAKRIDMDQSCELRLGVMTSSELSLN